MWGDQLKAIRCMIQLILLLSFIFLLIIIDLSMSWFKKAVVGVEIVKLIIENYEELVKEIRDDQTLIKAIIVKIKDLL